MTGHYSTDIHAVSQAPPSGIRGNVCVMDQKPPTATIESANRANENNLPFADTADFDDADRGFIGALEALRRQGRRRKSGVGQRCLRVPERRCADTVHPSLWRQSQLCAKQGLYEVVEGIYQVRGLDLSNISFIEGDTGIIVIDPLVSTETAAAALALYRAHRGDRPVVAVIYTHSHVDHFGGVLGVTTQADVDAGKVAMIAPEHFTEHAVQENVYAGTAMARRASYMYGAVLERGPQGQVGCGLGQVGVHRRGGLDRADGRHPARPGRSTPSTASRSSSRWRPAPRRPPRCTSTSRSSARCAWPRTPPTICTTC